jgi:hypothetical protein
VKYKNSFLFKGRVSDVDNSVEGSLLIEDAVEVAAVYPETAVITTEIL